MQPLLFDLGSTVKHLPPTIHCRDPITSALADSQHRTSGKRAHHLILVLGLVIRHPGSTACELWSYANREEKHLLTEQQEIRRRLTDLAHQGDVTRSAKPRACEVKGSQQHTWTAAAC